MRKKSLKKRTFENKNKPPDTPKIYMMQGGDILPECPSSEEEDTPKIRKTPCVYTRE
jgi:hypothetical protein